MPGPRRRAQDLLKPLQNHRIDLADALARRAELGRELDDPPSEVRGLIERHEQLRGWRTRIRCERRGLLPADLPSGMAPHVVWEIVEGQPAQRVAIEPSWGRVKEMATQEQKIVQALGGGAGSTHLMCPHCGKRVELTYRSSYELALDLAVREPRPDEEARPGDKG